MSEYNNNYQNGEDDGSLAFLNLPAPQGLKKSFHCDKTTQQKLANRTFWILDYDKVPKTKFGENKYIVFIKFDLNDSDDRAMKFFTGSGEIKLKLDQIQERKAFPRRVTLRMEGNNYWIE